MLKGKFRYKGTAGETVKRESGTYVGKSEQDTHIFVFSNAQVDRYGDTIDVSGWELDNYKANPIVLFGHDATDAKNVVGTTVKIWVENGNLMGEIKFVDEGINPNADMVRKLVETKVLRTVSVGFRPIEAKASTDPKRRGGWDFKKQELLETSIVPVPALPSALGKAAAAGFTRKDLEDLGAVEPVELPTFGVKSFWTIYWLASLLGDGQWLLDCLDGDDAGKDELLAGLQSMGQALLNMTEESVAELMEEQGKSQTDGEVKMTASAEELAFKFFQLAQKDFGAALALNSARALHEKGATVTFSVGNAEPQSLTRAGRVLSKDNEAALSSVKTILTDAAGLVDKVLAQVAEESATGEKGQGLDPERQDSESEEAVRKRMALALKKRASVN